MLASRLHRAFPIICCTFFLVMRAAVASILVDVALRWGIPHAVPHGRADLAVVLLIPREPVDPHSGNGFQEGLQLLELELLIIQNITGLGFESFRVFVIIFIDMITRYYEFAGFSII